MGYVIQNTMVRTIQSQNFSDGEATNIVISLKRANVTERYIRTLNYVLILERDLQGVMGNQRLNEPLANRSMPFIQLLIPRLSARTDAHDPPTKIRSSVSLEPSTVCGGVRASLR